MPASLVKSAYRRWSRSNGCCASCQPRASWSGATGRSSSLPRSPARRVNALATFRLEHIDLAVEFVEQDARTVRTKFAKTFRTYFMPVSETALAIARAWIEERRGEHLAGSADPLFPATAMGLDEAGGFAPAGLAPQGCATTEPIRAIFRKAFAAAGLPYYSPHSFRDMLVRHAITLDVTPEQLKAWSQNLGHADVLTTFTSYGQVPTHRQGELIRLDRTAEPRWDHIAALEAVLDGMRRDGSRA